MPQIRFGTFECFEAADEAKERLVQQELRNLHKLASLREILFVGNEKPKFVIRLTFQRSSFNKFEKVLIAAFKVLIVGEIALAYRARNAVKHSVIDRQCVVTLKRAARSLY